MGRRTHVFMYRNRKVSWPLKELSNDNDHEAGFDDELQTVLRDELSAAQRNLSVCCVAAIDPTSNDFDKDYYSIGP